MAEDNIRSDSLADSKDDDVNLEMAIEAILRHEKEVKEMKAQLRELHLSKTLHCLLYSYII